jgi:hypothetical protein
MPTKTDRILSYLPGTFRALPRPTASYSVVDAFGGELLNAENSLAALMAAHWVDHADRGAELIDDLDRIAALYGLAARPDETVEEFRDHLKRFIRIFLEGSTTVRGILRVTAEALGLRINDDYSAMDTWWTRGGDGALFSVERRGEDASTLLFGFDANIASGEAAQSAQITGTVDLSGGADLRGATNLSLSVNGGALQTIDLATQLDPAAAELEAVKDAINKLVGQPIANHNGRYLTLQSPGTGPGSRMQVADVPGDAAPRLLGLLPRSYSGAEATAAHVTGTVDLPAEVNLSDARYLRLLIDGKDLAEIDCAANNPSLTNTITGIEQAINDAIGKPVATHLGSRLTLTSPTTGFGSSIAFQSAAAQDARQLLFGTVETFSAGRDARPAFAVGINDLSRGVDLSARSKVPIRLDNNPPETVDCAGTDPTRTLLGEIVATLNAHLGSAVASHDGRFLRVTSQTAGLASAVAFEHLAENEDATSILFGIGSRSFQGKDATSARITGTRDLTTHEDPSGKNSPGVDLGARHIIQLAVDGKPLIKVDVASRAADLRKATLKEISDAINHAFQSNIAADDGQHLILTSPTPGDTSQLSIEPLVTRRRRFFVTRAFMTDEAAQAAFGFLSIQTQGTAAVQARVEGTVELSRGLDLRDAPLLRLSVDGSPAVEIDCAGTRPRATLIDEVVKNINAKLTTTLGGVASSSDDGKHLLLVSPTTGASSRIAFESPHAALDTLLGLDPASFRGRDATRVTLVGTVDLGAGIDLSTAAKMKISIDGEEHEIDCANSHDPAHTALNDIVVAINLAFGGKQVVRSDGTHIVLLSQTNGENSRIEFAAASAQDATKLIFGFAAPRSYRGAKALPAEVIGARNLVTPIDVSAARFLRVAVNSAEPLDVDCAADATDASKRSLAEIVAAVNAAFTAAGAPAIATGDGNRLALATTTAGGGARLDLLPHTASDARAKLFGDVPDVTTGTDPTPAVITGTADLLAPIDLSERRIVRLTVDSGAPVDVDIAGVEPSTTFLDEIVARINAVFPDLASATDDDRLRLTSATPGENSRLELQPMRVLELIDHPPTPAADPPPDLPPRIARPGDKWTVTNDGAAEETIEVELYAPHGAVGPQFVNYFVGQRVRIMEVVRPGERLKLWFDCESGLRARVVGTAGLSRLVEDSHIHVFSIGAAVAGLAHPLTIRFGDVLTLARGQSDWSYTDCHSSRFNCDDFMLARVPELAAGKALLHQACFAGGRCIERGVFNISSFAQSSPQSDIAVYSPTPPFLDPPVEIRFLWPSHRPGAFIVNLPSELPERFGGKFNQARFAHAGENPDEGEQFLGVVTEPKTDPDYLITRVTAVSKLVSAEIVPRVPIGFEAAMMPFRKPRALTLGSDGSDGQPARIYLAEKDVPGFIELSAKKSGVWGNQIRVVARKAGPALFDVTISFPGARFENARLVAMGGEHLPSSVKDLLKPGPIGVLQAKAAGVRPTVTRDGCGTNDLNNSQTKKLKQTKGN